MKKTFLMAVAALAISMSAHAIRAVHKLFPQKQSDGTTVMLYTNGDGRLAFYTTEDHQVVIRDSKGTLCYAALKDGVLVPTDVVVHNVAERTAKEKAFVVSNTLKPTDKALEKLLEPWRPYAVDEAGDLPAVSQKSLSTSTADGLGKYGSSAMGPLPSIGDIKIPVIMVEFSDVKFQETNTIDKISRFMSAEGYHEDSQLQVGSVRDYFKSQSRGMFDPQFKVVSKVTLDKSYAYYGAQTGSSHDAHVYEMIVEAVTKCVNQGVDFSEFERNYKIPTVIVMYAGYGQATGGDENTIWPHAMELPKRQSAIGDYLFGSYFVGNELSGGDGSSVMGMGVMVHELGHVLGLPDIYETRYQYQDSDNPMGFWSVMDGGEYHPDYTAYAPVGYNAYERSYMGWLDIRELNDAEGVKLSSPADTEGEYAVMLRNPYDRNEYFIFENRSEDTWFPASLGTGLLVSRYAYNPISWSGNSVNINQDKKRAMVVVANGRKMTGLGKSSDLFGNGVTNLTELPLFNGTTLSAPLYRIMKSPDGTLTFSFKDKDMKISNVVSNGDVYEKISDISSLATDDKIIFVNESEGLAMTSNMNDGKITSVEVKIEDGKLYGNDFVAPFVLRIAGPKYTFRYGKSYLMAANEGMKLNTQMANGCIAAMSITDGNASIVFGGTAKKKSLGYSDDDYLFTSFSDTKSNFQIYRKTDALSINGVTTTGVKKDGRVFNLAGQQVGDDYKGIVIVNGKKIVRK